MNDHILKHQLAALAEIIRDDISRAERMGRATIGLHAVNYYAQRLESLLADAGGDE